MAEDPRLVARSETDQGTRLVRAAAERRERLKGQWPSVDPDDLIRARETELKSAAQWRARLHSNTWDTGPLWWADAGGYTTFESSARKWPCQWDAYAYMVKQDVGQHTWGLERVPPVGGAGSTALAGGAYQDDVRQAWTRAVPKADGGTAPEDGLVHGITGDAVPTWALCGTRVEHASGFPWPPSGWHRCERCNSIAMALPWR